MRKVYREALGQQFDQNVPYRLSAEALVPSGGTVL